MQPFNLISLLIASGCHVLPGREIVSPPVSTDSGTDITTQPTGPAECGNSLVDGKHEDCDDTDDSECPGECSSACQCPGTEATGELSVYMIDVWQGDGLLVVSPDGFTMVVDAGDESTYRHFSDVLKDVGVDELDYSLVSHLHSDHMGAMDLVLRDHLEAGVAYDGGGTYSSQAYRDYVAAASDRRTALKVGNKIDLGPSMDAEILHSNIGDNDNENNNSVVLRLTYGDFTMLLGGDCEAEVCESAVDPGPINVYKVDHHGSSDSSSQRLLNLMKPDDALISVGEGNDYGHPSSSTLGRLSDMGVRIWRTDEDGDLLVKSDGSGYSVAPK